jgi:hypothetical protein
LKPQNKKTTIFLSTPKDVYKKNSSSWTHIAKKRDGKERKIDRQKMNLGKDAISLPQLVK